jgi:hypothetical protein
VPSQPTYGSQPAQPSYGSQPFQQSSGNLQAPYGGSPSQPGSGSPVYNNQASQQGFGGSPAQPPYGGSPSQPSYGTSPAQPGFGNSQPSYGSQPSQPGSGSQSGQSYGNQPVNPRGEAAYGQQPASSSPYFEQQPSPYFEQPGGYYGAPTQGQPGQLGASQPSYTGLPGQQYSSTPGQFPGTQQPVQRKRNLVPFIAGGLILLLLLSGILLYAGVIRPNQLHADATSTAQAVQATQVRGTAVANGHATATGVARANATATTTTLMSTPQGLYQVVTGSNPTISDPLSGPGGSAANWDSTQNTDGSGCSFNNSALHVITSSTNPVWVCEAKGSTYSDFGFQTQMTVNKGPIGGLIFRFSSNGVYFFTVNVDGNYQLIGAGNTSNSAKILTSGFSNAINKGTGQSNTLAVIARGATIDLYINRQFVTTANDSTATSGTVGIMAAGQAGNQADVSFTNAQIWQI